MIVNSSNQGDKKGDFTVFDDNVIDSITSYIPLEDRSKVETAFLTAKKYQDTAKSLIKADNWDISQRIQKSSPDFKEVAEDVKNSIIPIQKVASIKEGKKTFGVYSFRENDFAPYATMQYIYEKEGLKSLFEKIKKMPERIQDNAFAELVVILHEKEMPYESAFNKIQDPRVRLHVLNLIENEEAYQAELANQSGDDDFKPYVLNGRILKDIWKKQGLNEAKKGIDESLSGCSAWQGALYCRTIASFLITAIKEEGEGADEAIKYVVDHVESQEVLIVICDFIARAENTWDFQYILQVITKLDPEVKKEILPSIIFNISEENGGAYLRFLQELDTTDRVNGLAGTIKIYDDKKIPFLAGYESIYEIANREDPKKVGFILEQIPEEERGEFVSNLLEDLTRERKWKIVLHFLHANPQYLRSGISILGKALSDLEESQAIPEAFNEFFETIYPDDYLDIASRENSYSEMLANQELENSYGDPWKALMYVLQLRNKNKRNQLILEQFII